MINSRLIDRVERSLRKRLNIDVRAHLVRYAARAQSEEEFVNAAGRLLLDPRQRQHWLASWAPRIHTETSDTSPAPLDDPLAIDDHLDGEGGLPTMPGFSPTYMSESELRVLREALAHELGPIASVLVDDEAALSHSASQLRDRLHAHLETDEQRTRFLRNTRTGS